MIKNPPANSGDWGSIPGSGRSPGEGNGNPLQYSCLKNSMDRGAGQATVHRGRKELDTTEGPPLPTIHPVFRGPSCAKDLACAPTYWAESWSSCFAEGCGVPEGTQAGGGGGDNGK